MQVQNTIPIIIPSYEPDERLLQLLEKLVQEEIEKIIIVNDGSSEKYDYIFNEALKINSNITILRHDRNYGKGKALKTAFQYCIKEYEHLIGCVTADSDGQHSPTDIKKCQNMLLNERDLLILGVRRFDLDNVPTKSQFGNNLTRNAFRVFYKKDISDTQTGLRGIPVFFMKELLSVKEERFEFETKMLIKAVESNIDIKEYIIETIYDSKENHSTHFRPIRDSFRIYRLFGETFMKFVFSSLSSSAIDMILFQIICFGTRNISVGINYIFMATFIARICSAIYNYIINYKIVFESKMKHANSLLKYIVLAGVQLIASAELTSVALHIFYFQMEVYAKMIIDIFLFIISYVVQKKIIFKK